MGAKSMICLWPWGLGRENSVILEKRSCYPGSHRRGGPPWRCLSWVGWGGSIMKSSRETFTRHTYQVIHFKSKYFYGFGKKLTRLLELPYAGVVLVSQYICLVVDPGRVWRLHPSITQKSLPPVSMARAMVRPRIHTSYLSFQLHRHSVRLKYFTPKTRYLWQKSCHQLVWGGGLWSNPASSFLYCISTIGIRDACSTTDIFNGCSGDLVVVL